MGRQPWIRMVEVSRGAPYDAETHPREWKAERVVPGDGLPLTDARRDFMDWLMTRRIDHRTSDREGGKRLLRAEGLKTRRREGVTVFVGVELAPHPEVVGDGDDFAVLTGIGRLRRAGLVSADEAHRAWTEYNDGDTGSDHD